jgi:endonuclease/exonuclease/phosphatase family metal-dependent hydrolase
VIVARIALLLLALSPATGTAQQDTLKLATWNLEWLMSPTVFKQLKAACTRKAAPARPDVRSIPCDVAARMERSSRDFALLARYARSLDADVVALQEVDGPSAAAQVFNGYEFCFTRRRHVQNTGFAIRRGLSFRCEPDYVDVSLGDTLRRGAELTLFPGEDREIRLLNVHLKSGCSADPLNGPDKPCRTLARQVPRLEAWIDAQARARRRFAILGDFNRALLSEARTPIPAARTSMWADLDDADPPEADLVNAADGAPFVNCVPGQAYSAFIDHIILSRSLARMRLPGSFARVTFSAADARRAKLSDHCPVSVRLRVGARGRS